MTIVVLYYLCSWIISKGRQIDCNWCVLETTYRLLKECETGRWLLYELFTSVTRADTCKVFLIMKFHICYNARRMESVSHKRLSYQLQGGEWDGICGLCRWYSTIGRNDVWLMNGLEWTMEVIPYYRQQRCLADEWTGVDHAGDPIL